MLARGAKRIEFRLAPHAVRRADAHAAKFGLKRAAAIVTNNETHLRRIPGLRVENWLKA